LHVRGGERVVFLSFPLGNMSVTQNRAFTTILRMEDTVLAAVDGNISDNFK